MSWPSARSVDGGLDEILIDGEPTRIWLCGKRVTGPDPEAAIARLAGPPSLATIVCLCQAHEIDERYPDYVTWLTANEGARALWRPIPDLGAPPQAEAATLAAELNRLLDEGRSLIVHCGAGMGRAPTVAVGALLQRGHDLDVLLTAVADSRPLAGPESGAQRELVEAMARRRDVVDAEEDGA